MKPDRNEYTAAESHAHLESENSRLQRLVAELLVRNQQLREELKSASRSEKSHPSASPDSAQAHLDVSLRQLLYANRPRAPSPLKASAGGLVVLEVG